MAVRERSDRRAARPRVAGCPPRPRHCPRLRHCVARREPLPPDLYFNSWRLVPANLVWGVGLGLTLTWCRWSSGRRPWSWPPLLALPTVGIFRIASLAVRGDSVSFWDGIRAWRSYLGPALTGGAIGRSRLVLVVNLLAGLQSGDLIGWAFATLAGWGSSPAGSGCSASGPC